MKKITLVALLALSSSGAFAATACDAVAAPAQIPGSTTTFVQVAFTPKCSTNVLVDYSQTATSFAIASASKKGKSSFMGSTAGGGVVKSGDCPSTGCTATEVTAALTAAEALASGT